MGFQIFPAPEMAFLDVDHSPPGFAHEKSADDSGERQQNLEPNRQDAITAENSLIDQNDPSGDGRIDMRRLDQRVSDKTQNQPQNHHQENVDSSFHKFVD
jgi:hypothetical protein